MVDDMEVWASIPDFPWYEVSTLGRVRGKNRYRKTSNGQTRCYKGGVMRPSSNGKYGHLGVTLTNLQGSKRSLVHALVLLVFIGPRPEGFQCRHLNGNASDNRLSNLRYGTPKENARDKIAHGTYMFNENHPCATLKSSDVLSIRNQLFEGCRQKDLAAFYGVTRATIGDIKWRRSWARLTGGANLRARHGR